MELQGDRRLPVDHVATGHNQARGDYDPWAPERPTVHEAHRGALHGHDLVVRGGHEEACLSLVEPNISEGIWSPRAADDVPEDQVDRADQGEAYPLVRLPPKWRNDKSEETRLVRAVHHEQPSALRAWQAPGVCEDDGVVLSREVAHDAPAEAAAEEVQAEGAERRATSNHRAAFLEGWAALPGYSPGCIWAAVRPHTRLQDSEPAEGLGFSEQLLVLFIHMETPLVRLLENRLESSFELQAVHQHQQLGCDLPLTCCFAPGGGRLSLGQKVDADFKFLTEVVRREEPAVRGEGLSVGGKMGKREARAYHGSSLTVHDNSAAAQRFLCWKSLEQLNYTATRLHLLHLHVDFNHAAAEVSRWRGWATLSHWRVVKRQHRDS